MTNAVDLEEDEDDDLGANRRLYDTFKNIPRTISEFNIRLSGEMESFRRHSDVSSNRKQSDEVSFFTDISESYSLDKPFEGVPVRRQEYSRFLLSVF